MILTCPACATQYRLKDGAIPPEGRQVRCAACKHKWHQDGEAAGDDPMPTAVAPSVPHDHAAGGEQGIAGGPPQPDAAEAEEQLPSVPEQASRDAMIAETPEPQVAHAPRETQPPVAAPEWSAPEAPARDEDHGFAAIPAMHVEDDAPRRGPLRWIIAVVLIVVAAAAAFYFLAPPELKARAGIAEAGASSLQLMLTTSDRQKLASGNELLAISGRVINSTDRVQAVPPIQAELRDPATDRIVYQWTIAPPARSLAPGSAATFNSAEVDVPEGGESLTLRFAS